MSETLILPANVLAGIAKEDVEYQNAEDKAKQLPNPVGWKILCAVIEVADEYESGLAKAGVTKKAEEVTSPVLFVMKKGPMAYKDKVKFPPLLDEQDEPIPGSGHWCHEGDFIITRPYTGTRMMIHGREFRVIHDDQVEATVQDPRGISRA